MLINADGNITHTDAVVNTPASLVLLQPETGSFTTATTKIVFQTIKTSKMHFFLSDILMKKRTYTYVVTYTLNKQ